ncbi:MAG: hypothetical protein HY695_13095 [Deltaproteobacteria bacterium]|nr:hypothetical protein [Deltaproteobacteria bacterium]
MPALANTTARKFNLTRRFALLSLVSISILTVALWLTVSHYLTKETLDREWETTAKFIRTETRQSVTAEDFNVRDLSAVAEKFEKLRRRITAMPDIVRIKVYNSRGVIVWSDEERLAGTAFSNNDELQQALQGKVVADLSSVAKRENIFERASFQRLVEVYVPVFAEDGIEIVGVIETYKSAEALFRDIQRARMAVLAVTAGGGLLLYLSLFAIVRQAAKRLDEQQKNLLAMQSELNASQRMAAIGEMAAAVAHGIGNPIASIRAAAQVAKIECEERNNCDYGQRNIENLSNIIREVDRVQKRIRGLLNFARPLEPRPSTVNVNGILQDTAQALSARFQEAGVKPVWQLDPKLPEIAVDPVHIEQVVQGLLVNALEATPPGGTVTISSKTVPSKNSSQTVLLAIEDTGEGIPLENRERVFEPFFTTKPHGTGIGLPLAKKFVERNGGVILIGAGSRRGTRVQITFPVSTAH